MYGHNFFIYLENDFMREKKESDKKVNAIPKKEDRNRQYETPSQQRNRDGKGRERNGSDGDTKERGMNR